MIRGSGSPRGTAALKRHFASLVDSVVASEQRFPDGAHFRVEIPSVEPRPGPALGDRAHPDARPSKSSRLPIPGNREWQSEL